MEYFKPHIEDTTNSYIGKLIYDNDVYTVNDIPVINNRGLHGDIVLVNEMNEIIGINIRTNDLIVGIIHLNGNTKYGFTKKNVPYYKFSPISNKYPSFIVPCKNRDKAACYCVIKFNKWDIANKNPIGQLEYFIGPIGNIDNEINMLLYKTNIYPKKTKNKYLECVDLDEKCIDYKTFSIDPIGCRDIDDALHYKELNNGNIEIGIHIANVARYIDSLNTNYYSSIYLNSGQLNMLDDKHTFEKCSLGNGVKRNAMSLILVFDKYVLVDYKFKEVIIRNTALSYKDVEEIIGKSQSGKIYNLWEFTSKIKNETELSATKMVEHYMLLYNSILAETLYKYNKNTVLRTHRVNDDLLDNEHDKLSIYLTRLKQNAAKYETNPDNTWHQDLSIEFYTHATSPIRRYVDIINQKNIINYIENKPIIIETPESIDSINSFQKNLRKFYNNYKKLTLIFNLEDSRYYSAYIIGIDKLYVKIYIPDIDIEHSFQIISKKLIDSKSNTVETTDSYIIINGIKLTLYSEIKIKFTPLKYEQNFNRKINIELLEPNIEIY
jgi:exoribonuclease R